MKMLFLPGLLLALGLSGCAAGVDYHAPLSTMPATYPSQALLAGGPASSTALRLDAWWNTFNDPELTRIIQRVLAQNLDLAAALARVDQARALAAEASAQTLPSGALTADAERQHQSLESPLGKMASALPGYKRDTTLREVDSGASWELDLFGGLKRKTEAASAEAEAAEADRLGVRITLVAEAADAYFRVRGAQNRIALTHQQIDTDTHALALVRMRQDEGLATGRDVDLAEALLAQASATLPPLEIERSVQMNRLDVLMGAQPGTWQAELKTSLPRISVPDVSLSQGPADLLRRRPDVIAAERRLAASSANIGAASAAYYPRLTLSALLGVVSLGTASPFSAAAFQPQAALGLSWRLFDFGRVDAEVAQARGANAEALAHYRQSMLRATEDVENAVVTLVQLTARQKALEQEVGAHLRAQAESRASYEGGATSLYEVLDEERQLLIARDQLAGIQADDARAAVSLFRALGGGW
jgi:NodT family efflux transporter outer membrane factor (OMF) lipoprotein